MAEFLITKKVGSIPVDVPVVAIGGFPSWTPKDGDFSIIAVGLDTPRNIKLSVDVCYLAQEVSIRVAAMAAYLELTYGAYSQFSEEPGAYKALRKLDALSRSDISDKYPDLIEFKSWALPALDEFSKSMEAAFCRSFQCENLTPTHLSLRDSFCFRSITGLLISAARGGQKWPGEK
jgi:hypothetical protein